MKRERFLPEGANSNHLPTLPESGFWTGVFKLLYDRWGDPYWWPARDAWEVAAGAILTQNTSWKNVEKAIANLRQAHLITANDILHTETDILAETIRSSGYYRMKARKLKELAGWWIGTVENSRVQSFADEELRSELLQIWGVGPETADAIACYALGRPIFVVDSYTQRMVERLRGLNDRPSYDSIQDEVHSEFPTDNILYNYLHGLTVVLGKLHCLASSPHCSDCPTRRLCQYPD